MDCSLPGSSVHGNFQARVLEGGAITDYSEAFNCVNYNKLWEILKEMGIPDTLPVSWETYVKVKKQQLEPDTEQQTGSKLGKEYVKAVPCHPTYLTYKWVEYIRWNAWLDEAQAGIKTAGRNINILRYADDTHSNG